MSKQARQPVHRHGRRVTSLWQRRTKDGRLVFDAQIRVNGKPSFRKLDAQSVDEAIAEAAHVRSAPVTAAVVVDGACVRDVATSLVDDMRSGRFRQRSGKAYKASTVDLYEIALTHRIVEELGPETSWRTLTRVDIDRLVDELAGSLAANTARSTIATLRTLDRYASRRLGTARLTIELESVPLSLRKREPVLTDASAIAKVPDTHRVAAALCLYAGLRASEACAVEWRHDGGDLLTVEQQLDHKAQGMTEPKSRNSVRQVPISPALRAELDAHAERTREKQDELAQRRPLEGRVYAYNRHVLRRSLKRSVNLTPQDLRHSFKERLRGAGVGEVDSARLAGHSPKVGSTHYASADSAERARALGAFS